MASVGNPSLEPDTRDTHHVDSPTDLPMGSHIAYHVAPDECVDGILDEGLDPEREREKWSEFNSFLETVAAREGVTDKPESRAACSFAYTNREQGTDPTVHLTGYVTLAIDLHALSAPLYAASYGTASAAYSEFYAATDDVLDSDSDAYAAACDYWASFAPYDATTNPRDEATELLINGPVPATTITHILGELPE